MQCYPKRPDFELSRPKVFKMICIFSFFANCSRSNMMANNPTQHLGNYRIQIMFSNYGGSLNILIFFKVTHFLKICESKNLCRQFCRHPTFFVTVFQVNLWWSKGATFFSFRVKTNYYSLPMSSRAIYICTRHLFFFLWPQR